MEQNLADWDTIAGVPTHENRYIDLGDWELDQAVDDLQAVMGDLGELPIGTDLWSFVTSQSGHVTRNMDGTITLAHGEDKLVITARSNPLILKVKKDDRSRGKLPSWPNPTYGNWSAWKSQVFNITVQPGQSHTVTNGENGETTDQNITLELIDIPKTAAEVAAEQKRAELDKTLSNPAATEQAKALATAEYTSMQKQAEAEGSAAAARASAAGAAATGAAIESFVWPVVILGTAGMGLLLAWLYLAKDKV